MVSSNYRGSNSDSDVGGMYGEARSQLLGSCKHTKMYEFRPFAEEVTALRLGARRRSIELCVFVLQGVRTLGPEEEGGLYRVRQDPGHPPLPRVQCT